MVKRQMARTSVDVAAVRIVHGCPETTVNYNFPLVQAQWQLELAPTKI